MPVLSPLLDQEVDRCVLVSSPISSLFVFGSGPDTHTVLLTLTVGFPSSVNSVPDLEGAVLPGSLFPLCF